MRDLTSDFRGENAGNDRRKEALNGRRASGRQGAPAWYEAGLAHVWLPYAQMKTARPPLPVARTEGCRIVLADGTRADRRHRVLVDRLSRL